MTNRIAIMSERRGIPPMQSISISKIGRLKPLCNSKKGLVVYHKGMLSILSKDDTLYPIVRLPTSKLKVFLSRFRILERILRIEPRIGAVGFGEDILISSNGTLYQIDPITKSITNTHLYRTGMANPLSITVIDSIPGFENCLCFGEYFSNSKRETVSIYQKLPGQNEWKIIYTFPSGSIRHIHSIVPDKIHGCVYILTGDSDEESGIWCTKDNFRTVTPLLHGDQKYRTCCLFPTNDGFIYATDTPRRTNYIYSVKLQGDSVDILTLGEINGSCICGASISDKYLISSTVEGDEEIAFFRKLFTRTPGPGILSDSVVLYSCDATGKFAPILSFKKDFWPLGLCQFGLIQIVPSLDESYINLYPIAVKKYDGYLCRINKSDLQ